MPISDDQVATIHAFLSAQNERFQRLNQALGGSPADRKGYLVLIFATFVEAVGHRFAAETPQAEIIEYVADVRARSADAADRIDPDKAERVIRAVFDDGVPLDDVDAGERTELEMVLALAIVSDAGVTGTDLDGFLDRARKRGEEILG
jgi:hypothetical protein